MFNPVEVIQDLIRFPSVSTDSAFRDGMTGCRDYLCKLFAGMGLEVEVLDTPLHPVILAERKGPEEWPHVVIYGHYDVQPADPVEKWTTAPYEPEIREGRLYGRGAADNKGPMMVHITAAARLLEKYPDLPLRLTFLIEGEEEIGSPSFPGILEKYADRLRGDFVLLSDTSSQSPEQITITTGLRGIVCFEVEMTGPRVDLHSGMHGGALYNPIQALTEVCASLHDAEGRVNVPGFYDDVVEPEEWERKELEKLDLDEEAYRKFLGVESFHPHPGYSPFESIRFLPTLEFNGIGGGYQGEGSKTVIPSRAFAKVSCRLVANQSADKIRKLVQGTIRERAPKGVQLRFEEQHSGNAYLVIPPDRPNTPADQNPHIAEAFRAADAGIGEVFGNAPAYTREGGSVPIIGDLKRVLGMDSVMIGMFTVVDNLHAPDESFHLGMFEKGAQVSERILARLAKVEV